MGSYLLVVVHAEELGSATPCEEEPECPPEWKIFQNFCYYFRNASSSPLNWNGATSECKALHEKSSLPSVHNAEEDKFLKEEVGYETFWLGAPRPIGSTW